jgi:hypothetical protein
MRDTARTPAAARTGIAVFAPLGSWRARAGAKPAASESWSVAALMRGSARRGVVSAPIANARPLTKAHMRAVRERLAAEDTGAVSVDIRTATVRKISLAEARGIIERYEPMAAVGQHAFGIFFDGRCGG